MKRDRNFEQRALSEESDEKLLCLGYVCSVFRMKEQ